MKRQNSEPRFVVCVNNKDYPASLELLKIYQAIPDAQANAHQCIRIVDESGGDYLYPADYFVPIEIPQAVERAFSLATPVT